MGDPAGVGPELCLRALADEGLQQTGPLVVLGNRRILERVSRQAGLPAPAADDPRALDVPMAEPDAAAPARVQKACGAAALACIERAVAGSYQA